MIMRDDATQAQVRAARPDASTWLAANAGSGKTRVLTDRVARLLLQKVEPQNILCLTYTKAAASEMQNRLFARLGEWAMLGDQALRESLQELGVEGHLDDARLRMARTLFASAIETPGGLKIQTIHSFCASLLRRFPLEAGISPQFTEIEERAAELLRADIVDQMADGPDARFVHGIARYYTGEDFSKLTRAIVGHAEDFAQPKALDDVLTLFGQQPGLTRDAIAGEVFLGSEQSLIDAIIPVLVEKGKTDGKAGHELQKLPALGYPALSALEAVFLTKSGAKNPFTAKIDTFPTKPSREQLEPLMADLNAFMQRVQDARDRRLALEAAEMTVALHEFAQAFLPRYEAAKQLRGWLDFDDLILRARNLLNDPHVAAWVLYRIDGGIDHILVDEAQDTSPRQWEVIEKLADEFSSGEGARDGGRTLFVVGDKKQSIYSFQGADPREFDRKQKLFEEKLTKAGQLFQNETLAYSFRSSGAILRAVDQTFDRREQAGFDKTALHRAFKSDLPGRVDLWPFVDKTEDKDDRDWFDPVDQRSQHHHTTILANQIAQRIKTLVEEEHYIPDDGAKRGTFIKRRITPGDFLILVQRRSSLFADIIRACKSLDLPIAGADRLKVGAELAVRDLAALLSFLATPEDDLSLATALRSPLFGWSEQMLFDLTHRRTTEQVWPTLRKRAEEFPETTDVLHDLRNSVDFLRPYDLIERILTRHGGRRKLLSRLGTEAEDGINALLSQALAYEQNAVPSLTGFLVWLEADDLEIKRQIDGASDQIRVMTVHGAKGLEAPIVILPDTAKQSATIKDDIIKLQDVPVWKTSADKMPATMSTRIAEMKDASFDERLRLLYVAMTRAEKWLIVAASGDLSKENDTWYQLVQSAMGHINALPKSMAQGEGLRFEAGDWDGLPIQAIPQTSENIPVLEPIFQQVPDPQPRMQETVSPSNMKGAKALPGEGMPEQEAKAYGTLVHRMLEVLPTLPSDRRPAAVALFPEGPHRQMAFEEALKTLEHPGLASIFDPSALTEVSITADLGSHRLHGTIDRLIVTSEKVTAIDFKTNRVVPSSAQETPVGILRQLGAYAVGLQQIFPNHQIETGVVWTHRQSILMVPHDIVMEALEQSPYLDDTTADT